MDDILTLVFAIAVLGHGVAHLVATVNLGRQAAGSGKVEALSVRSWLLPSLSPTTSAAIAILFWLPAAIGFSAAVPLMFGLPTADAPWSAILVGSALLSAAGIGVFSGIWPGGEARLRPLHVFLALGMDAILLVTQLLGWPKT
jgi:hypothetical protein